ncbi:MAG: sigma-70 family RNA polymerase sigma factor [Alphaproteobacteria bacterium]|nr:sigma-70 family RNA polymerase sigma factor [Alphaproteobacteria bacterium]
MAGRPGTVGAIETCIPALRRYAAVLARNQQDRDDLVHDCLVRALDRWHTRRDDGSLKSWLFAIMHNLFVSHQRKRKLRGEVNPINAVWDEKCRIPADQERHLEFRDVVQALDRLPEEQRSVLVLVAVEDLSYSEVAKVLDIPIGTVMSRLSRGRERLRAMMEVNAQSEAVVAK